MSLTVVVGTQWGDEGKGAEIDRLSQNVSLVARYAGGGNAGHTIVVVDPKTGQEKPLVLHLLPSAVARKKKIAIGAGVIIDPLALLCEVATIDSFGLDAVSQLTIDPRCSLVMVWHRALDMAKEIYRSRGGQAIGTTGRGIGPTYSDIADRSTIRLADILHGHQHLRQAIQRCAEEKVALIQAYGITSEQWQQIFQKLTAVEIKANRRLIELGIRHEADFDFMPMILSAPQIGFNTEVVGEVYWQAAQQILTYNCLGDVSALIHATLDSGGEVLIEGAQGTFLDNYFGSWPYVTSSHTIAGGACVGLGIAPQLISGVRGIAKAYTTRVGNGPFPTRLEDELAGQIRGSGQRIGDEFGATTGRPRDIGWFDAVLVRTACLLNGIDHLTLTKLDMLTGLSTILIGAEYSLGRDTYKFMPADHNLLNDGTARPVYITAAGWPEDLTNIRSWQDLPYAARDYVELLEETINAGLPLHCGKVVIDRIGVGPRPEQLIIR